MRAAATAMVLAWAAAPVPARAARPAPGETGAIGLGVAAGDPLGAAAKIFLHPRHALSSHVGFGAFHLGAGRVDLSYLFHSRPWGKDPSHHSLGYIGLGAGAAFWSRTLGHIGPFAPAPDEFRVAAFFFRAPVLGLEILLHAVPVGVFIEAAYSPLVGPPVSYWNFDFALGARYWF